MRSGKYGLAVEHYKQILSKNANSAQVYEALGNAYRLSGDRQNAVASFQKAAALAPKDPAPHAFLAETQADAGDKAAAINSFKKALELSPDNVVMMNNLAYLMGDSGGNLDEALALVQKALRKAPGQPNLIDTLGWIYLKKGWNDSALQVFRDLTDKNPNSATFRYHLGMALLQKGDKATAKAEFRSGLARKPSGEMRQNIETALATVQ
jgi:Flp pilus assembly protein TadD